MIILKNVQFISNGRIFRAGEALPDNPTTRSLVEKGFAEIVADTPKKSAKTVKKPEPDKVDPAQENVKSNP